MKLGEAVTTVKIKQNRRSLLKFLRLFFIGLLGIVLLGLFGFSIAGYGGQFYWIFDLTAHFKGQYFILSLILLLFFLILRAKKWGILCVLCLLLNLVEVAPWYFNKNDGKQTKAQLRLLSLNTWTENKDYEKIISLVDKERPDFIFFMEIDKKKLDDFDDFNKMMPYSVPINHRRAIYSTYPIKSTTTLQPEDDVSLPIPQIDLMIDDQQVSILVVELESPISQTLSKIRNQQLMRISEYINQVDHPVVVIGDFNISMWSLYYKNFIRKSGLRNARRGFGVQPSWQPFGIPIPKEDKYHFLSMTPFDNILFSIPIDHCLVSSDIVVIDHRVGEAIGSDHLPLLIDLSVSQE